MTELKPVSSVTIKNTGEYKDTRTGKKIVQECVYKIYGDSPEELVKAEKFIRKESLFTSNSNDKEPTGIAKAIGSSEDNKPMAFKKE